MSLWSRLVSVFETTRGLDMRELKRVNKIAIIVGHSSKAPGASIYNNPFGFKNEYNFNAHMSGLIVWKLRNTQGLDGYRVKSFDKNGESSKSIAKKVAEWGADVSLELHLNAVDYPAYGCELLLMDNQEDEPGMTFINNFSANIGIKTRHRRGIKSLSRNRWYQSADRGYYNLYYMAKYGVKYPMLIEPAFCNHKTADSVKIIEGFETYTDILAKELHGLIKW